MVADKKNQKIFIKAETLLDKGETKDAIYFYNKAAKKGHAKAQYKLGFIYLKQADQFGNIEYVDSALEWLNSAGKNGFVGAYKFLHNAYFTGDFYLAQD